MAISRRDLLIGTVGVAAVGCTSTSDRDAAAPTSGEPPPDIASTSEVPAPETSTSETIAAPQATTTPVDAPAYVGDPPFALGIASGDPDASSVVLWTRLITSHDTAAPAADDDLRVAVDVAIDEEFDELISSTLETAPRDHGHSVHALAEGLPADTWFHYRFRIGAHTSPTGRMRTLPSNTSQGADTSPLRFGFSSCQNWESGAYAAHRRLADEDLDLFVWLGDYIYESGPGNNGDVTSTGQRVHNSPEVTTLDGYRQRYALYKSDEHLQSHHAARPWLVTWDDHEVDNNHATNSTEDGQDIAAFAARRAAAYQAWWEHMPVRIAPPVAGEDFVIYRSIEWGNLAHIHMLDGRQYRSPQPTDGAPVVLPGIGDIGVRELSDTARDPSNSMLGPTQLQWLETQVNNSSATWNALGNQVYMHGLNAFPSETVSINTDSWDGYFGEREALLNEIGGSDANLIVLSGDFHASTAADLRTNPFDSTGDIVATEFMAPAISSTFPASLRGLAPLVIGINPQVRNFSPENGYMTCEVTPQLWTTRLHVLENVTDESSGVVTAATFTVDAGRAGVSSIS